MLRRTGTRQGHRWKTWSAADHEAFCGRWFCSARTQTQHGAFIERIRTMLTKMES